MEELAHYMARVQDKELFVAALVAFRDVNVLVFGTELGEGWRESLHSLGVALVALHTSTVSLPITPQVPYPHGARAASRLGIPTIFNG